MREIDCFNATIALRRSRRIFGSNTFAKRASLGLDGHMGMGITPRECCFYRRSGKLAANSEHVDMARALCWDGIIVLLGAYFLLSLDIPL